MNKIIVCLLICLLTVFASTASMADEVVPYADQYFNSASAFLASNKLVVFNCVAFDVHNRIAITNVWLEKQIDGEWEYAKTLTPPSYVATNMADYGAEVDYSALITGTGTFRVGFTVYADGYILSRYSNSRTF